MLGGSYRDKGSPWCICSRSSTRSAQPSRLVWYPHFLRMFHSNTAGPNAIRILDRLGVVDDMIEASGEKELSMLPLRYMYAMGDHEIIHEVRPAASTYLRIDLFCSTPEVQKTARTGLREATSSKRWPNTSIPSIPISTNGVSESQLRTRTRHVS